mgnify:CR=1 FL=1
MSAILRAPFPYFGGKRRAAALVWEALGDVAHYVEPFAGSAAVLLARPHVGRCETINDLDGMVSNFWRAVRAAPAAVAEACDWPVIEADLHARHLWLIGQRESLTARLVADVEYFDARAAGWWAWGACMWIGDGWCSAKPRRKLPNIGGEGRGVHRPSQQLPHLSNAGVGVHAPRRASAFADEAVEFVGVAEWLQALSLRLRAVRVASGDWRRVVTPSVLHMSSQPDAAVCGVYLDPPYLAGNMDYAAGGTRTDLSAQVREWCADHGGDRRLRIVLSGHDGEHAALESVGWRVVEWKTKGGYASAGGDNANQRRERLWLSPACVDATKQRGLFDAAVSS